MRGRLLCAVALAAVALPATAPAAHAQRRTENVVIITTDGLRWQELFRGAERRLIDRRAGGVADTTALLRDFWREDPAARRARLFPFLWGEVAARGVVFGNQDAGSIARITNPYRFSYPGYAELFTGFADPDINSNAFPPNLNVTVLEWLARQPRFRGRVGAIGTWDVFHNIFNAQRAGIDVRDGWDEPFPGDEGRDARRAMVNDLYRTGLRYWPEVAFDAPMQLAVKEYIRLRRPRVLFVGYGETDEWAHGGRYDLTLRSAHQVDAFIRDLWTHLEGIPQYRGRTTFIITTDHGRGSGAAWTDHGREVAGAEDIWVAVLGPDTPALGEVRGGAAVQQAQVAATIAAVLGLEAEFRAASPRAAPALPVLRR